MAPNNAFGDGTERGPALRTMRFHGSYVTEPMLLYLGGRLLYEEE
jgi:hypothetical protein